MLDNAWPDWASLTLTARIRSRFCQTLLHKGCGSVLAGRGCELQFVAFGFGWGLHSLQDDGRHDFWPVRIADGGSMERPTSPGAIRQPHSNSFQLLACVHSTLYYHL